MNLYPVTEIGDFYGNSDAIRKFAFTQTYKFRHEERVLAMYILDAEPKIYLN